MQMWVHPGSTSASLKTKLTSETKFTERIVVQTYQVDIFISNFFTQNQNAPKDKTGPRVAKQNIENIHNIKVPRKT